MKTGAKHHRPVHVSFPAPTSDRVDWLGKASIAGIQKKSQSAPRSRRGSWDRSFPMETLFCPTKGGATFLSSMGDSSSAKEGVSVPFKQATYWLTASISKANNKEDILQLLIRQRALATGLKSYNPCMVYLHNPQFEKVGFEEFIEQATIINTQGATVVEPKLRTPCHFVDTPEFRRLAEKAALQDKIRTWGDVLRDQGYDHYLGRIVSSLLAKEAGSSLPYYEAVNKDADNFHSKAGISKQAKKTVKAYAIYQKIFQKAPSERDERDNTALARMGETIPNLEKIIKRVICGLFGQKYLENTGSEQGDGQQSTTEMLQKMLSIFKSIIKPRIGSYDSIGSDESTSSSVGFEDVLAWHERFPLPSCELMQNILRAFGLSDKFSSELKVEDAQRSGEFSAGTQACYESQEAFNELSPQNKVMFYNNFLIFLQDELSSEKQAALCVKDFAAGCSAVVGLHGLCARLYRSLDDLAVWYMCSETHSDNALVLFYQGGGKDMTRKGSKQIPLPASIEHTLRFIASDCAKSTRWQYYAATLGPVPSESWFSCKTPANLELAAKQAQVSDRRWAGGKRIHNPAGTQDVRSARSYGGLPAVDGNSPDSVAESGRRSLAALSGKQQRALPKVPAAQAQSDGRPVSEGSNALRIDLVMAHVRDSNRKREEELRMLVEQLGREHQHEIEELKRSHQQEMKKKSPRQELQDESRKDSSPTFLGERAWSGPQSASAKHESSRTNFPSIWKKRPHKQLGRSTSAPSGGLSGPL